MKASVVIKSTGEVVELDAGTPEEVVASLLQVREYTDAYKDIDQQLRKRAVELIDSGEQLEHAGHRVRLITAQRRQYDPFVLREVFTDEDLLASFYEPAKGRIDAYIEEHLDELGENSTRLRSTMVPVGTPFTQVRLERTDRR